jgi:outer membrane receptor protein involved in Fe transport
LVGFNPSEQNPALVGFGPETVNDFFLGLKQDLIVAGMHGRFDIEGYYDLYHGMQVSYLSSNVQGNLITVTTNVPDTTFRGFGMQFTLEPTHWLSVNANYSLIGAFNTKSPSRSCCQ